MSKDFVVVEFTGEQSVAAVPTNWLTSNSTECWWPQGPAGLKVASLIATRSNPAENWIKCKVEVLKFCGKYYTLIHSARI